MEVRVSGLGFAGPHLPQIWLGMVRRRCQSPQLGGYLRLGVFVIKGGWGGGVWVGVQGVGFKNSKLTV